MTDELSQLGGDGVVAVDALEVVDDENGWIASLAIELVEESIDRLVTADPAAQPSEGAGTRARRDGLEGGHEPGPGSGPGSIVLVQREPGCGAATVGGPRRHEARLARPGRSDHERQWGAGDVVEELEQPWPREVLVGEARRAQLGALERRGGAGS